MIFLSLKGQKPDDNFIEDYMYRKPEVYKYYFIDTLFNLYPVTPFK